MEGRAGVGGEGFRHQDPKGVPEKASESTDRKHADRFVLPKEERRLWKRLK